MSTTTTSTKTITTTKIKPTNTLKKSNSSILSKYPKLDSISSNLDRLLDVPKWTDKELAYYNMLKSKISKYEHKIRLMELDEDIHKIKANISEQDWFKDSTHSNMIFAYLDEMEIEHYSYDEQEVQIYNNSTAGVIESNLIVRFPRSKFKLIVYFFVDPSKKVDIKGSTMSHVKRTQQSATKFYAYVEDYNRINRCFIACYDNEDSMGVNETIKLPDLSYLLQIVKVGYPISKLDLLRMFVEIILFYDESEKISRCFIGVNYPLTIGHFLRDFSGLSSQEES